MMQAHMTKDTKIACSGVSKKSASRPIGGAKSAKFAAVDGLRMNASSKALDRKLTDSGLTGGVYRAEVIKAFKKG